MMRPMIGGLSLVLLGALPVYAQSARGVVLDRDAGAPLRGATIVLRHEAGTVVRQLASDSSGRFTITDAPRGFHLLEVTTPAHDQLGYAFSRAVTLPDSSELIVRMPSAEQVALELCDSPGGVVAGRVRVRPPGATQTENLRVALRWDGGAMETSTDPRGLFRLCGAPVGTDLVIRLMSDSAPAAPNLVRIAADRRLATVELVVERARTGSAVLAGVVRNDKGRVVGEAEVALPTISRNTFTNERGEFRLTAVAPGQHDVVVRRVGYRELAVTVSLPESGEMEREFVLSPVTTLDTVAVRSTALIPSFEENRAIGLGKFLTRLDLEKLENLRMAEVLQQVGAPIRREGPNAWVGALRTGMKMKLENVKCATLEGYRPRIGETHRNNNPGCGCYAQVYLDNAVLFNGEERGIVPNINMFPPSSIESIEYYRGASELPMKYSMLNAQCGVVVLHTRRPMGKAKAPEKNPPGKKP